MVKNPPANAGDMGSIPGSGRSPGEGNGNPLQYSCLEYPMDRGAWQATIHGGHKRVGHNLMTKQQHWMNSPRVIMQSESGRQPEPSQGALQYLQVREEDPTKETTGVASKVGRKLGKFDDVEADELIS